MYKQEWVESNWSKKKSLDHFHFFQFWFNSHSQKKNDKHKQKIEPKIRFGFCLKN